MNSLSRVSLALAVLALGAGTTGCSEMEEMHLEVGLAPAPASCGAPAPVGRLCGCVYDVSRETRHLPDFGTLRPAEMLCVDRLAVSLRNGPPGFPGVTGRYEWFGVDFQGTLVVAQPGVMSFRLASDDGAKLYVDDALVLNNDGFHDIRVVEGQVALDAGPHRIRVPYYDGPGPMALTLEVARPGQPYEILRLDHAL
jgi:PA14 domain